MAPDPGWCGSLEALGHHDGLHADCGGFSQPDLSTDDPADLATEAEFADDRPVRRDRLIPG